MGTDNVWPLGGATKFLTFKRTLRELNSLAVSCTSLLCMSVETRRRNNFRLVFTKCKVI